MEAPSEWMFPYGLVQFASTMVGFVALRKAGKAHLLMPHQTSIGLATGWVMLTSVLAAVGVFDGFSPAQAQHVPLVFFPQQAVYATSLLLRGEVSDKQLFLAFSCLVGVVAIFLLRTGGSGAIDTDLLLCAVGATLLVATMLPGVNQRIRCLLGLWAVLLLSPMAAQTPFAPLPVVLLVEQLSLLTVKLQFLTTSDSKKKPAAPGWAW